MLLKKKSSIIGQPTFGDFCASHGNHFRRIWALAAKPLSPHQLLMPFPILGKISISPSVYCCISHILRQVSQGLMAFLAYFLARQRAEYTVNTPFASQQTWRFLWVIRGLSIGSMAPLFGWYGKFTVDFFPVLFASFPMSH